MLTTRSLRIAALAVVMALIAGMAPGRISAARAGGSFESATYGVSITWDEGVWTGTEADLNGNGEGVNFESLTSSGTIQAVASDNADAEDCLNGLADILATDDSGHVEDFGPASRRIERPAGLDGGANELYTYTFIGDEGTADVAIYIECDPLPSGAGVLQVFLATDRDIYPDVVQEWNDLIGGVSLEGGSSSSGKTTGKSGGKTTGKTGGKTGGKSTAKTGIKGDVYTNVELGFSLGWDGEFWTATEIDEAEVAGVELDSGSSYAYIFAATGRNTATADKCLAALEDNLKTNESFTRTRVASASIARPESIRKAAGELYTFYAASDTSTKMVAYVECRPLASEGMLTLQFATTLDAYEDELPQWQQVLDSIDLKAGASSSSSDKPSKKPTAVPDEQGSDAPANTASVAGPNLGVEIAYDDTVWTPRDNSDDTTDQFVFDSDFGQVHVLTVPSASPNLPGCVQTLADNEAQYTTDGLSVAPRSYGRPDTGRGAEAELFAMTINGKSGPVDALYYVECRATPDGSGMVAITFTTIPSIWEVARPVLEGLLAGIQA